MFESMRQLKIDRIPKTVISLVFKIKIFQLFSGLSEVKISLKTDVSSSFTGPFQVVEKLPIWRIDPPYAPINHVLPASLLVLFL